MARRVAWHAQHAPCRCTTHLQVRISYLELYNEAGFDLLDSGQKTRGGGAHEPGAGAGAGAYGGGGELGCVPSLARDERGVASLLASELTHHQPSNSLTS